MPSKSKDVRMEQLRVFEKKLALRLEQLEKKGISKEKAQNDALVKSLKSKIKQTRVRIAVFDKFIQKKEELAKAKAQKLADLEKKEEESGSEEKQDEPKPKKKQSAAKDEASSKATDTGEAKPKKAKKQSAAGDEAAPKKKAAKKEEE
ncbi:MAG TPA: hypothetical protein PLV50_05205 [Smithella sp.]|nr:hypothetical protein [Smithella sp.]MDM7986473.1 hypothetical protein [Smithella sp.]HNY50257.1 hypothetical protein [Smithella sp.]HOG89910.1 hypothetical protein [Smithella sp.]HOU49824.1 hypothetical protein [Smithella sp.]